ncbi:MAG: hypothetical protein JWO31_188 [Phycisphaerales bacterium]|nr:hypothetical protein [Phycisphaerales bacterium]
MSSSSSRRDFLRNSGLAVMAGGTVLSADQWLRGADMEDAFNSRLKPAADAPAKKFATSDDTGSKDKRLELPTLVTIFLRGGCDAMNAIVPYADDQYYKVRPRIAIPKDARRGAPGVIKLGEKIGNGIFGLNPGMASFAKLMEQGKAAAFMNIGSPNGSRSHFSAQDNMERGTTGDARVNTGWLNRYLLATRKSTDAPLRGLCAMNLLPRSLRGEYPVLAGSNRTENMELFEDLYAPSNLINQTAREQATMEKGTRLDDLPTGEVKKRQLTSDWARDVISDSGTSAVVRIKALESAMGQSSDAEYPGGGLGNQLRAIAKVIKANVGLEVAQADYGGWDTHADQGTADGKHTKMLKHVSDSIAAFLEDLGPRSEKVTVMVMSEFGRTVHENGSEGTDHGRGGMMLVAGGPIRQAKVYGTYKGVADMVGDYQPVYTDFRAVFAEAVMKMFNYDPFNPQAMIQMFPGYKPKPADYLNYMNAVKKA